MDVRYALLRSCNTWFYQLGMDMGPGPLYRTVKLFGLTDAPAIPLEGVSPGMMPKGLTGSDHQALANFSIGQGEVLTSPLQLALAMGALANGKFVPKPQLIVQVRDPITDEVIFQNSTQVAHRLPFKEEDLDLVRAGMFGVVNHSRGTARGASMSRPRVYGKTGTSDGNKDLWFIGSIDNLTTGIWIGYDDNKESELSSGNAAYLWKKFISEIYKIPIKK